MQKRNYGYKRLIFSLIFIVFLSSFAVANERIKEFEKICPHYNDDEFVFLKHFDELKDYEKKIAYQIMRKGVYYTEYTVCDHGIAVPIDSREQIIAKKNTKEEFVSEFLTIEMIEIEKFNAIDINRDGENEYIVVYNPFSSYLSTEGELTYFWAKQDGMLRVILGPVAGIIDYVFDSNSNNNYPTMFIKVPRSMTQKWDWNSQKREYEFVSSNAENDKRAEILLKSRRGK